MLSRGNSNRSKRAYQSKNIDNDLQDKRNNSRIAILLRVLGPVERAKALLVRVILNLHCDL